jgi:2,4-dienoyl-CoA reductase-like NADH-dependent reductase (Old Yellow Enzyme family)
VDATGARALTTHEVDQVVADFVAAAVRAEAAGFHEVELHGAHGYLLCQFLSGDLNRRTDRYGGSLENRARLLLEIVHGVRAALGPDTALRVRLSTSPPVSASSNAEPTAIPSAPPERASAARTTRPA